MKVKEIITENTILAEDFSAILKKFPWLQAMTVGLGAKFVYDHYTKLQDLEEEYKKYLNGDTTTELFKNKSPEEALKIAQDARTKLIGESALVVGAATKSSSKMFYLLSNLVGKFGGIAGAVAGGLMGIAGGPAGMIAGGMAGAKLGSMAGAPIGLLGGLAKLVEGGIKGTAFVAFMDSALGQKFLNSYIMQILTTNSGKIPAWLEKQGMDALKSVGVDVPKSAISSIPTQSPTLPASGKKMTTEPKWNKQPLIVVDDEKNPKIRYVNNVQITDNEGYQSLGDRYINGIKQLARLIGAPDPTENIPKKPGRNYNY